MTQDTLTPQQRGAQTRARNAAAKAAQDAPAPDAPAQDNGHAPATLAAQAVNVKAAKRRPVFRDVHGIPRVPLADGRVGCVQAEQILTPDGIEQGPHMLTIPRKNQDGTESGQRYPLADVQLLADGFASAGVQLV